MITENTTLKTSSISVDIGEWAKFSDKKTNRRESRSAPCAPPYRGKHRRIALARQFFLF